MCMLTFFPEGVQPNAERLLNGSIYNNDGHGFAIVVPSVGEIIVRKSMDADYLVAEFVRLRGILPDGPAMFHSRWGTGGDKTEFNCHPFYVHDRWANPGQKFTKGDEGDWLHDAVTDQTVVGHNGVLQVTQPKDDRRCDTRMAAEEILGEWYDLSVAEERNDIAEWIGTGNKLVFLTVDARFDKNAYIINEKRGVWDEGVWYSNYDYVGYNKWESGASFRNYSYGYENLPVSSGFNPWANDRCPLCSKLGTGIDSDGFCTTCDSCVECIEQRVDCTCYVATTGDKERARQDYIDWWTDAETSEVGVREDVLAGEAEAAAAAAERDAEIEAKLETISDVLSDLGITREEVRIWMRKTGTEIDEVTGAVQAYQDGDGSAEAIGPEGPSEAFDRKVTEDADDYSAEIEEAWDRYQQKTAKRVRREARGTIKGSIVDLRKGSTAEENAFDEAIAESNRMWAQELRDQEAERLSVQLLEAADERNRIAMFQTAGQPLQLTAGTE